MSIIKRLVLYGFMLSVLITSGCDHARQESKVSKTTQLTERLQPMFRKSKTVCFGRFLIDLPQEAAVSWGSPIVPLYLEIYPGGKIKVKESAKKFIDDLKSKKAIYHDDVPLLISVEDMSNGDGLIVTGYESFESVNDLSIHAYFSLDKDGVIIKARPLRDEKDDAIALINSMAHRLQHRTESEIPSEPGNCIEHAFLKDKPHPTKEDLMEHIRIGFRLNEFADAHFLIYVAPADPHMPEQGSLEKQFKKVKEDQMSDDERKVLVNTKFLREKKRAIHEWETGYEVLMRTPDESGSFSHHDFLMKFLGVAHDSLKPYADIQFQTGVAHNAAGKVRASLTDAEALAIWDKITSTIRVRPTISPSARTAFGDDLRLPLGEIPPTGRGCAQPVWRVSEESDDSEESGQRQIDIRLHRRCDYGPQAPAP